VAASKGSPVAVCAEVQALQTNRKTLRTKIEMIFEFFIVLPLMPTKTKEFVDHEYISSVLSSQSDQPMKKKAAPSQSVSKASKRS
jgi:hypothetical protein